MLKPRGDPAPCTVPKSLEAALEVALLPPSLPEISKHFKMTHESSLRSIPWMLHLSCQSQQSSLWTVVSCKWLQ